MYIDHEYCHDVEPKKATLCQRSRKNDECSSNWANKFEKTKINSTKIIRWYPRPRISILLPKHPLQTHFHFLILIRTVAQQLHSSFPYFFLCEWSVLLKFVQYVNHLICNNFLLSPLLVLLIIEVEWAIEQDHIKDIENFFFVFLFMGFWFPMGVAWLSAVLFGDFLGVWNNGQKFWISRAFSWINFMWIQVQENFQISCEYKCRKIFKKRGKLKFSRYIYKMND